MVARPLHLSVSPTGNVCHAFLWISLTGHVHHTFILCSRSWRDPPARRPRRWAIAVGSPTTNDEDRSPDFGERSSLDPQDDSGVTSRSLPPCLTGRPGAVALPQAPG